MIDIEIPQADQGFLVEQSQKILASYQHWTGQELLRASNETVDLAQALFEAPFVVLSSDTSIDPLLNYGNRLALSLWETDWESLRRMPGRTTAEPDQRKARELLLAEVRQKGYSSHYSGVRVTASGKRFRIENALIWNLLDEDGRYCGQAASFKEWSPLYG